MGIKTSQKVPPIKNIFGTSKEDGDGMGKEEPQGERIRMALLMMMDQATASTNIEHY